jgi:hypothetical protein
MYTGWQQDTLTKTDFQIQTKRNTEKQAVRQICRDRLADKYRQSNDVWQTERKKRQKGRQMDRDK